MRLLRRLPSSNLTATGCVATIGNFDGLHRGHQHVITQLQEKATELDLPATVISFEPLPAEYFRKPAPSRIYPLRDKLRLLQQLGIQQFACLNFDDILAQMEAEAFIREILIEGLQVRYLVVGDDFRFGRARRGDYAMLRQLGEQHDMSVVAMNTFMHDAERISSTRIRHALEHGHLKQANALLGFPYRLSGRVRHGDKRGRTIGFPTLNLRIPANIAPRKGVYAVRITGLSGVEAKEVAGVANLGTRPTVDGVDTRLEIHLFDFDQQVYGQYICVELVAFVRDEQKFSGLDELMTHIKRDAEQARYLLRE